MDIGCGSGGVVRAFTSNHCEARGFDMDSRLLEYGVTQGIDVRRGDGLAHISEWSPDLVIVNHVLEHLTDPRTFMVSLDRSLAPGTLLYIAIPGILRFPNVHNPNQLLKYFVFAHPWSFDLSSMKSCILNETRFKIVAANEDIDLLLVRQTQPQRYRRRPRTQRILANLAYLRIRESLAGVARSALRALGQ